MSYSQMTEVALSMLHASGIEKNKPPERAFYNEDVVTLTWDDLSVKVTDRATGLDKFILSSVSGHVKAGTSQCPTPFGFPDSEI